MGGHKVADYDVKNIKQHQISFIEHSTHYKNAHSSVMYVVISSWIGWLSRQIFLTTIQAPILEE